MPKFTEQEKIVIYNSLLLKGRQLFENNGLFKVTIDDLTSAASISKGSFYAFFESKEHLFMKINYEQQEILYSEIEAYIKSVAHITPVDLVKESFILTIHGFLSNPFLSKINIPVMNQLIRKLGNDMFEQLNYDDEKLLKVLAAEGIKFKSSYSIIVKSLRGVLSAAMLYYHDDEFKEIMSILCKGLAEQII